MSLPLIELTGKVALITGASSGIGARTGILFSQLGARVALTGRKPVPLDSTALQCEKPPCGEVFRKSCDLSDEKQCRDLIDAVIERYGRLDVLVNVAGILLTGTLESTTSQQYDELFDVNVKAPFRLSQMVLPYLEESRGNIVNVSSVNGMRSFPGVTAYNMSKAAMDHMTRSTALELAPKGIRVNCVNPGVTVTDLHRRAGQDESTYAAFLERAKSTHPLGRPGEPVDVANAIAFLASGAASFITGVTMPVDGGRHATCLR